MKTFLALAAVAALLTGSAYAYTTDDAVAFFTADRVGVFILGMLVLLVVQGKAAPFFNFVLAFFGKKPMVAKAGTGDAAEPKWFQNYHRQHDEIHGEIKNEIKSLRETAEKTGKHLVKLETQIEELQKDNKDNAKLLQDTKDALHRMEGRMQAAD